MEVADLHRQWRHFNIRKRRAFSPTQRAQLQTAQIALQLHRGDALYEGASKAAA